MTEELQLAEFTTESEDVGNRIDRVIAERLPQMSRSRVKALIEAGHVTVDGVTIGQPSAKLRLGQEVRLDVPPPVARPVTGHLLSSLMSDHLRVVQICSSVAGRSQ